MNPFKIVVGCIVIFAANWMLITQAYQVVDFITGGILILVGLVLVIPEIFPGLAKKKEDSKS